MNTTARKITQETSYGSCTGMIDQEAFEATYVELVDGSYPPPHGEANVMLAIQRAPDYSTKELKISFSKGLPSGSYPVGPDHHQVRILYIDSSNPEEPTIHSGISGEVNINYDEETGVLDGELNVEVEDADERSFTVTAIFSAERVKLRLRSVSAA